MFNSIVNCGTTVVSPLSLLNPSTGVQRLLAGFIVPMVLGMAGTAFGQSGPQIVSVTPTNGAVDVATNSTIVILFDRDMDTTVIPIGTISGAFIGNFEIQPSTVFFTGSWGLDKRTLTLQSAAALPFNTTISWTLNPPGGTLFSPLASAANEPVETVSGSFQTGANVAAGPAPKVESVIPANGAVNVSPNSELVIMFDLAMDTNVILNASFPPAFVGNYEMQPGTISFSFQGSWGADARTLTFKPFGPLPQNTLVNWTLNPAGTATPLKSAAGQPLLTTNGSFRILANTGGNTNEVCNPDPTNLGYYGLTKSFAHTQISATEVISTAPVPGAFTALVQNHFTSPAPVTNASLTLPNETEATLTNQFGNFLHAFYPASEAQVDPAYPPGTYTLRMKLSGGQEQVIPMNMPPTMASIPMIQNYAEAQAINTTESFTLRWYPFTPLPANAYITLFITDEFGNTIFQAPNVCLPRELLPSDTSVVIPAHYFKPGQRYNCTLAFGLNFYHSTNAVPQMQGNAVIVRSTTFTLEAAGGGGVVTLAPATFLTHRLLPNGNPEMTMSGTPGESYTVQRSSAVTGAAWVNVGSVTMDVTGTATFEDTTEPLLFPAFYRVLGEQP
ncbi:MAG: Ig-like domain-containing protein [Verrucomicrobiae bacterium]|nr:Ig-like domain-containing protein [Verrucomicrobiae bacterium]